MKMQHSSETCSTKSESSINTVTTQEPMQCTSKTSPKPLPEWSTLTNFNQLRVNDLVVYDDDLARVTFIDQNYITVTPQHMHYGVLVFPQQKSKIKYLSTGNGQLSANVPVR